jgi:hypothetical protein
MEGREKPCADKYKGILNDWNYEATCALTSLIFWVLENFKCLIFVVRSVNDLVKYSGKNGSEIVP